MKALPYKGFQYEAVQQPHQPILEALVEKPTYLWEELVMVFLPAYPNP